jgi:hypothetical protein
MKLGNESLKEWGVAGGQLFPFACQHFMPTVVARWVNHKMHVIKI